MNAAYFDRSHLRLFSTVGRGQPDLARAFFGYYGQVFAEGALSERSKSLIALAVAHVVQCPYCIDAYTADSLEKGADLQQLTEAVHVAAMTRGGSVLGYSAQMSAIASGLVGDAGATRTEHYFDRAHVVERDQALAASPALRDGFGRWERDALVDGELSAREKALIFVACAHCIQSPYQIDRATKLAIDEGANLEQLTEAVHVAVAIRGGASLVHAVQMLEQVDARSMG